jgi:hypothetical protein
MLYHQRSGIPSNIKSSKEAFLYGEKGHKQKNKKTPKDPGKTKKNKKKQKPAAPTAKTCETIIGGHPPITVQSQKKYPVRETSTFLAFFTYVIALLRRSGRFGPFGDWGLSRARGKSGE